MLFPEVKQSDCSNLLASVEILPHKPLEVTVCLLRKA